METLELGPKGYILNRCTHGYDFWQKKFYFVKQRKTYESACNLKDCVFSEQELATIFLYFKVTKAVITPVMIEYRLEA